MVMSNVYGHREYFIELIPSSFEYWHIQIMVMYDATCVSFRMFGGCSELNTQFKHYSVQMQKMSTAMTNDVSILLFIMTKTFENIFYVCILFSIFDYYIKGSIKIDL